MKKSSSKRIARTADGMRRSYDFTGGVRGKYPNRLIRKHEPIHPGEVLLHDFLQPLAISPSRLADGISVQPRRVREIVRGTRAISADTALRFARFFGTLPQFWLNLQAHHDLEVARDRPGRRLEDEVEPFAEAGSRA